MVWQMPWAIVQRMIVDLPRYEYDENTTTAKEPEKSVPLTAATAQDLLSKYGCS